MEFHAKSLRLVALGVLLAVVAVAAPARAEEKAKEKPKSTVRSEMLMWIGDAEDKLAQLAAAMPEDKYGWRPGEGVRSAAEVFMHVCAANFGIPSFWGVAPPEGFKFETYEQSLTKKADIQKALTESFAHMKKAFETASDADLEKSVNLFGQIDTSVRGGYMLLLSHAHEHLGQSIAYARTNGVVPPWTAKAAEATKAEGQ